VIVAMHVATGGAIGALSGSRMRALLLGPPAHLLADRVPHQDIASRRFEIASGAVCLALLALRRGPFERATLGAVAASAPDLEHIFPAMRVRGRKVFHGRYGWHRSGSFPASAQLVLAGAIVGYLLGPRKSR
jgi:hypothetical protein